MSVSAVYREESVRQRTTRPVEGISVAVFTDFEPDIDVHLYEKKVVRVASNTQFGIGCQKSSYLTR
jgi:hypothetical protein